MLQGWVVLALLTHIQTLLSLSPASCPHTLVRPHSAHICFTNHKSRINRSLYRARCNTLSHRSSLCSQNLSENFEFLQSLRVGVDKVGGRWGLEGYFGGEHVERGRKQTKLTKSKDFQIYELILACMFVHMCNVMCIMFYVSMHDLM